MLTVSATVCLNKTVLKNLWVVSFQLERMCRQFHASLWYNTGFTELKSDKWKLTQLIKSLNRSVVCSYVSVCGADVHLICLPVSAHKELLPASVYQTKAAEEEKCGLSRCYQLDKQESLIRPQWADILMAAALIPSLTFSLSLVSNAEWRIFPQVSNSNYRGTKWNEHILS